jgi:hypothetical protein
VREQLIQAGFDPDEAYHFVVQTKRVTPDRLADPETSGLSRGHARRPQPLQLRLDDAVEWRDGREPEEADVAAAAAPVASCGFAGTNG